MPMNRIQFQPGLSLPAFLQQFGTETQCETALEGARWPDGFRCPHCGEARHYVLLKRGRKTFQCQNYRQWFGQFSGGGRLNDAVITKGFILGAIFRQGLAVG